MPKKLSKNETRCLTNVKTQINNFWNIEEIILDKPKSEEDIACKSYFINTILRENNGRYMDLCENNGRYVVCMPFHKTSQCLSFSHSRVKKINNFRTKVKGRIFSNTRGIKIKTELHISD